MLELPEIVTLCKQLTTAIAGRTVACVLPPSKPHKFCWHNVDTASYDPILRGAQIVSAEGVGFYVEILFDNGLRLSFRDGINVRLIEQSAAPKDYQLLIGLDNGQALVFTVAMYGGFLLHKGDCDNPYYLASRQGVSPLSPDFPAFYAQRLAECKPTLSAKAFLATEQRFPGIGNGVLQDILFDARIHPKTKLSALSTEDTARLLRSTVSVLTQMTALHGRDTERDLFGQPGEYRTRLSKNTLAYPCPQCGGPIVKEAYLGGSVYFCPTCQPLQKNP